MSDAEDQTPKEGDVIGPDGSTSPAPTGGDGKAADDAKGKPRSRATGKQTEQQRKEEEEHAEPFRSVLVDGPGWWRGPGWEPSDKQRLMVQMLKFSGYTDEDVAATLYMSVETLQKFFDFELKQAKKLILGDLATRAVVRARQGDNTLLIFLLKVRGEGGAFSEKAATAAAITDSLKDVEGLSDEKKATVIASLVDLLNPKKEKAKAATKEGEGE